ncbi:hypothetical protein SAMN06295945_0598 [Polynucleobacter meluiroseus]|uniref:Uncharacterized protein n=1 Tax=Polynucleobacter meluiroseus TaxID=1938814 RepID=A0A240DZ33_9BURK|nr:hypothetical protein [Polynucleobacter meluiroseus]SNX28273.1 hypothetical protein SAMN06295945_0598 [Polynucleobacter meluiroseus]
MKQPAFQFQTIIFELSLSAILYTLFYFLNLWLTSRISPEVGAHWIFIPAGISLLLSLVLPITGPLGITLAVFPIAYLVRFPGELIPSIGIAIIAGFAPYISRHVVVDGLKINHDLSNLCVKNLVLCVLIYSTIRAMLHHYWYVFVNLRDLGSDGLIIELVGNSVGTLLVLLVFKFFAGLYINRNTKIR